MKFLFTCLALFIGASGFSQSEFSLYRLNGNLAQANMLNPAFAPNSKLVIGLPVVSSIYVAADNDGISFRDLFGTTEDDSLKLDTLSLFSKLKPSNSIQVKEAVQLFYFGLRGKRSYFSFAIHQVLETRFNYPGDLVGWAIRGPGDHHYSGKPLNLGNFYGRGIAYGKISLNYARDITDKLRLGARFNYLIGIAAGESTEVRGSITMGIDSVSINTGRIHLQTAGVDFFDRSNLDVNDYKNYFLKGKNKGMSLDLGGTYNLTNNLMLSAAVNDLGYISWKGDTRSYEVDPVNYTFKGFDLLDYLNQSAGQQFLEAELDSLDNLFDTRESTGNKFKTPLIGKFYAGVNFKLLRINNFSALFYFDLFRKKITPAISLGYNLQLGRLLNTTVGITYQNGKINNIGAGIALKLTHLQFYATSDRANSFVYPARASRADAHLGMNLVFGRPNKKAEKKKEEETEEEKEEPPATPVVEPVEPPADSTQAVQEPIIETPVDTVREEQVVEPTQATPAPITTEINEDVVNEPEITSVVEQPVTIQQEPRHETVKMGTHEDELPVAHYVIVGAFRSKQNAQKYSRLLKEAGYDNQFGFVTEKNYYYVHVLQSPDLDETRKTRDQFRKIENFQFAESWVLSVE